MCPWKARLKLDTALRGRNQIYAKIAAGPTIEIIFLTTIDEGNKRKRQTRHPGYLE